MCAKTSFWPSFLTNCGRITAKSAGLGKEFLIFLPRSLIAEAPQTSTKFDGETSPRVARRVLIADDNRDGAESLSMVLELSGHEVHLTSSGTQALEVANKIRPDVAVLDIGMPDLNGYEVAERIRLEPWGEQITLIALTGWGQETDKRRAQAAGFDHHCTKPVDPDALMRCFAPQESSSVARGR